MYAIILAICYIDQGRAACGEKVIAQGFESHADCTLFLANDIKQAPLNGYLMCKKQEAKR